MKQLLLALTSITSGASGYFGYSILTTQIRNLADLGWLGVALTLLAATAGVWISFQTKRHLIVFGSSALLVTIMFYFAFHLTYGARLKA
jgi:hypothetical protein